MAKKTDPARETPSRHTTPVLVPCITRGQYMSGGGLVLEHDYFCTNPNVSLWLDQTFRDIASGFIQYPPDLDAGTLTLTLQPWTSGGETQPAVEVRQNAGESVTDFVARAKRTFSDKLEQYPPD